jgi:hypothetical protein
MLLQVLLWNLVGRLLRLPLLPSAQVYHEHLYMSTLEAAQN